MNAEGPIRALIVDDEPLVLQGLKKMIDWQRYGVSELYFAGGSDEALELSRIHHPDIVLADIKMPEISGIELISMLKDILQDAIYIIITGYTDFEYAKQAIYLGVSHYLLKPIQTLEFIDVIKDAVNRIRSLREQKNRLAASKVSILAFQHITDLYFQHILDDDADSIPAIVRDFDENGTRIIADKYMVVNIACDARYVKDAVEASATVVGCLTAKLAGINLSYMHYYMAFDSGMVKLLLSSEEWVDLAAMVGEFHSELEALILRHFCGRVQLTVAVGQVVSDCVDICLSARSAARLIRHKRWTGDDGIYFAQDFYKPSDTCREELCDGLTDALRECILTGNEALYITVLERVDESVKPAGIEKVRMLLMRQLIELTETFEFLSQRLLENLDSLRKCGDRGALMSQFRLIIKSVCPSKRLTPLQENVIITGIKTYIEEHLSENISLMTIAQDRFYNANYLSRLFKKETGENFVNYVHKQRINLSKKLLSDSNLRINEIAECVGYNNYVFFYQIFRRLTGMSPQSYRKGSADHEG